ncbi:MAG: phosphoesterase [Ruminococcaceae bacterium]|nr:phosphoesterase [Oscillospiraceae bacterium]
MSEIEYENYQEENKEENQKANSSADIDTDSVNNEVKSISKLKSFFAVNSRVIFWIIIAVLLFFGTFIVPKGLKKEYIAAGAVIFITLIIVELLFNFIKKKINAGRIIKTPFYRDNTGEGLATVKDFRIPMVFADDQGDIIWSNQEFRKLFNSEDSIKNSHNMKRVIKELFMLRIRSKLLMGENGFSMDVEFAGRQFVMNGNVLDTAIVLYFVDNTDYQTLKKISEDSSMAVGIIAIDSFEELYQEGKEAVTNQILVALDRIFAGWLEGMNAVIKKLDRDRYILLIEDQYLKLLERARFSILDETKKISVGNSINITLSIGIAVNCGSVADNYKGADSALDLAARRGGDQAVVKRKGSDTYFGGSSLEIERRTKVKAKSMAALLKAAIEKSTKVLIMGHSNCDMDSLGSALAVYRACCISGKKAKIILNKSNKSIDSIMNRLVDVPEYSELFINTTDALNLIDEGTLVVVVDTYNQKMTEAPTVLDNADRVAVIDHHRRGADFIEDTELFYSETYASSTSELMVEILGYYTSNVAISKLEAEAMYSGIWVDTKGFTFKTGIRTFEAATYLKSQGVNTVDVRRYFQSDFETFALVQNITATTEMVHGNIGIAVCKPGMPNPQFLAALAADQLLTISELDASFVLAPIDGDVAISGRSLGDINVQVILEKMGGGGHLTSAGARMKDVSTDYVKKTLVKHIEEVLK